MATMPSALPVCMCNTSSPLCSMCVHAYICHLVVDNALMAGMHATIMCVHVWHWVENDVLMAGMCIIVMCVHCVCMHGVELTMMCWWCACMPSLCACAHALLRCWCALLSRWWCIVCMGARAHGPYVQRLRVRVRVRVWLWHLSPWGWAKSKSKRVRVAHRVTAKSPVQLLLHAATCKLAMRERVHGPYIWEGGAEKGAHVWEAWGWSWEAACVMCLRW